MLFAAKSAATSAVQNLRVRERNAILSSNWNAYQQIAAAYDVVKAAEDAATSKLIHGMVMAPPHVANQLAAAVQEMEHQIAKMQQGQASLSNFISAMSVATSAINLVT
jgi:hypothetical protein